MVILLDTNVILNYLLKREPGYLYAEKILRKCAQGEFCGYMAFHSISILWYVLRKIPDEQRRVVLKNILAIINVTGASHEAVLSALDKADFKDFEDCLQDKCAVHVDAHYIVTDNIKDFQQSVTPAITSEMFCERFIEV